nr:MAG TPA: hypothetical protein [Caudoviricetes sp.]
MESEKNIIVSDVTFEVSYNEDRVQCFASVSKVNEHFTNVSEALLLVLREAMQLEPMAVSYKYGVNVVLTDEYDGYSYSVEAIHKSDKCDYESLCDLYPELHSVLPDGTEIRFCAPYRTGLPCEKDWEED